MYGGCGGGGRGRKCDGRDADQMWHQEGEKRESGEWEGGGGMRRGGCGEERWEMGVRRGGNVRRAWRGEKRWERKDEKEGKGGGGGKE